MAVLKNVQFSKLIKAEGRLREFNFRKSNGIAGPVYHVDVSDDRGNRYYINMLLEDNTGKKPSSLDTGGRGSVSSNHSGAGNIIVRNYYCFLSTRTAVP